MVIVKQLEFKVLNEMVASYHFSMQTSTKFTLSCEYICIPRPYNAL